MKPSIRQVLTQNWVEEVYLEMLRDRSGANRLVVIVPEYLPPYVVRDHPLVWRTNDRVLTLREFFGAVARGDIICQSG
jgi:hypothetical protein